MRLIQCKVEEECNANSALEESQSHLSVSESASKIDASRGIVREPIASIGIGY
jgi:hypothetical protein